LLINGFRHNGVDDIGMFIREIIRFKTTKSSFMSEMLNYLSEIDPLIRDILMYPAVQSSMMRRIWSE